MVETNSNSLYKNFQFEYCWRLPLPRFVPSCFLFCGMVRNGIPSCFLFRWKVKKGIPRVGFYYRNSELFSLPLKGSEGNSERLLLFLFRGTEFRVVFSSAEGFGTEFRELLFRGTAGIPSEITICSVNSVFRGIIFSSKIPNPNFATHGTFRYFELCSICLREGLGSSKPATNPWNKHNNTTVGISTISKPYWTVFYRTKWALQVWVS